MLERLQIGNTPRLSVWALDQPGSGRVPWDQPKVTCLAIRVCTLLGRRRRRTVQKHAFGGRVELYKRPEPPACNVAGCCHCPQLHSTAPSHIHRSQQLLRGCDFNATKMLRKAGGLLARQLVQQDAAAFAAQAAPLVSRSSRASSD